MLYCWTTTTGVVLLNYYNRCCIVLLNYYHRCCIVLLNYYHRCRDVAGAAFSSFSGPPPPSRTDLPPRTLLVTVRQSINRSIDQQVLSINPYIHVCIVRLVLHIHVYCSVEILPWMLHCILEPLPLMFIVLLNYYDLLYCIVDLLPQVLYCRTITTGVVLLNYITTGVVLSNYITTGVVLTNYYHSCCTVELLPQLSWRCWRCSLFILRTSSAVTYRSSSSNAPGDSQSINQSIDQQVLSINPSIHTCIVSLHSSHICWLSCWNMTMDVVLYSRTITTYVYCIVELLWLMLYCFVELLP